MRSSDHGNGISPKSNKKQNKQRKGNWTETKMRKANTESDIILKWQNFEQRSCTNGRLELGRGRSTGEGCCSMWQQPQSEICWSLARLSVCPSSSVKNGEPGSCRRGKRSGGKRSGFYLLRLTGRLSLFLRRKVLRWYCVCVCVWVCVCVCPRLARTGLLTSGGFWKPFTLNLAPF